MSQEMKSAIRDLCMCYERVAEAVTATCMSQESKSAIRDLYNEEGDEAPEKRL